MYKRWRPSSRRDRRRGSRRSRQRHQEGIDRVFFIALGVFVVLAMITLATIFFLMRPGG